MNSWRTERTGWRDQELSERHGHWGFNCPAVDLDFVMMEYNYGKPSALVEYKHVKAKEPDTNHATYRALIDLADGYKKGPLPCFIAFYNPDGWQFKIIPLNDIAKTKCADVANEWISEQRFVKGLHRLRKKTLTIEDQRAIDQLNS